MQLYGMPVRVSELSVRSETRVEVVRWSSRRKKRRNWTARRVTRQTPGCFVVEGALIIHPDIFDKIKWKLVPCNFIA